MAEEKETKRREREEDEDDERREETTAMKPWEQHSAVISIPRFDYKAPSSLLQHSHSGFLITCPIKREKSATKEAITIFEKCTTGCLNIGSSLNLENSDADTAAKRRKSCVGETEGECSSIVKVKSAGSCTDSDGKEEYCLASASSDKNVNKSLNLSLVKLTGSGLLLFTLPRDDSVNVVYVLSEIMSSLELGTLSAPLWCHRIFPIQATCQLKEKELYATVSKLVTQFVDDKRNKLEQPIKFGVRYNRRGSGEKERSSGNTSKDSEELVLLDRDKCVSVVAAAVKCSIPDSVVDLKSPELSIILESLPVSGLSNASALVAVSVLPSNLVTTKPRLCVKALSDAKARNGKKNQQRFIVSDAVV